MYGKHSGDLCYMAVVARQQVNTHMYKYKYILPQMMHALVSFIVVPTDTKPEWLNSYIDFSVIHLEIPHLCIEYVVLGLRLVHDEHSSHTACVV